MTAAVWHVSAEGPRPSSATFTIALTISTKGKETRTGAR